MAPETTHPRQRLQELGITLPDAPKPVAAYVPAVRTGNLIYVSGQVPLREGALVAAGAVPSQVSIVLATEAARQCAINGLAVLSAALEGDLDRVTRIVRLGVFVCSDPGFTEQPKVANGASTLLQEVFGERGRHARAAVGSVALPLGAAVEVEMLVEVS
jgi:enamine deaminase RidA (YjgF/YER057c/UK114 family)